MLRRTFEGPFASSCVLALAVTFSAGFARAGETPPADSAAPAAAAPTEAAIREASEHYEAGLALYADGEFKRAAIEFDRAYELVPNYRALYNIGQVRIQLHDYARAFKALQAYLKEGGDKIDADRRKSVNDDIEMLSTRTATLAIDCNEAGADILVDGELAGTTPLPEPLLLDTGDHRIIVRKEGFDPRETPLTLASRDTQSLRVDLQRTPPDRGPVVVVAPQAQSDRTAWIWGTWSATAAFAAGAAVTGGLGIGAANDLDHLRSTYGSSRAELDSAGSRATTLLRAADVLGAAAIVTGGIALYLTLSRPPTTKDEEKKAAPQASVRVGPSSVSFSTTF
ncbi:MAG TPA: PEGA domain-containing protein [Polyangiaceae bacterium]|nr:PEGA domain-containing protein [Polyangiaceae bacterium]